MQIPVSELRAAVKRLSTVKTETYLLDSDAGRFIAADQDLTVIVESTLFQGDLGFVPLHGRKFSSVVNRVSGKTVELSKVENHIELKSAKAKVQVEILPAKPIAFTPPKTTTTLPLPIVKSLLQYAASAADANKAAAFGGIVQLETVNDIESGAVQQFRSAGTDGFRIAIMDSGTDIDGLGDTQFSYLLPLPAVAAIQSLEGDILHIAESETHFYLHAQGTMVLARKLSKQFPNYGAILPKSFAFEAEVDATEFKQALNLVQPMLDADVKGAVSVHFSDGQVTVRTLGKSAGAEDAFSYQGITPDPMFDDKGFEVPLSHKLLTDFVSGVSGKFFFRANERQKPVVMEAENRKYMLAPVAGV